MAGRCNLEETGKGGLSEEAAFEKGPDKRRDLCGEMSKQGAQPKQRAGGWHCKKAIRLGSKVSKILVSLRLCFPGLLRTGIISDSTCPRGYGLRAREVLRLPQGGGRRS